MTMSRPRAIPRTAEPARTDHGHATPGESHRAGVAAHAAAGPAWRAADSSRSTSSAASPGAATPSRWPTPAAGATCSSARPSAGAGTCGPGSRWRSGSRADAAWPMSRCYAERAGRHRRLRRHVPRQPHLRQVQRHRAATRRLPRPGGPAPGVGGRGARVPADAALVGCQGAHRLCPARERVQVTLVPDERDRARRQRAAGAARGGQAGVDRRRRLGARRLPAGAVRADAHPGTRHGRDAARPHALGIAPHRAGPGWWSAGPKTCSTPPTAWTPACARSGRGCPTGSRSPPARRSPST